MIGSTSPHNRWGCRHQSKNIRCFLTVEVFSWMSWWMENWRCLPRKTIPAADEWWVTLCRGRKSTSEHIYLLTLWLPFSAAQDFSPDAVIASIQIVSCSQGFCPTSVLEKANVSFLANVNSRSRSLYAIARPSVVCLYNVRAPCSAGWNFRQCFFAVW